MNTFSNSPLGYILDGSYFEEITKLIFEFSDLESHKNLRFCNSKIKKFIDDIIIFEVECFEDAINLFNKGLKVSNKGLKVEIKYVKTIL